MTDHLLIPIPDTFDPPSGIQGAKLAILASHLQLLTSFTEERRNHGHWINLHSYRLRRLFGNDARKQVIEPAKDIGLIEINDRYRADNDPFTKSYRLDSRHRHGKSKLFTLSYKRLIARYQRNRQPDVENLKASGQHLHSMADQFSLDPAAIHDPRLKDHWSQWMIARWVNRQFFSKRCGFGRLHSLMTQTPRIARKYLNGELSIVDVSACQPLLIGRLAASTTELTTTRETALLPYVVQFLPNRDCRKWIELCQNGAIYQHLHDRIRLSNLGSVSTLPNGVTVDLRRQSLSAFKRSALVAMFDTLPRTLANPVFQQIAREFPTIADFVIRSKRQRYQATAGHLQSLESMLMIDGCGNHLRRYHAEEPVQTIHDAILCRSSFADSASQVIRQEFNRLGLNPRLKSQIVGGLEHAK